MIILFFYQSRQPELSYVFVFRGRTECAPTILFAYISVIFAHLKFQLTVAIFYYIWYNYRIH